MPAAPIYVQRADKTTYIEADQAAIARMVNAGIVEGVGPRSGRIRILRVICSDDEAISRFASLATAPEPRGSITSQASREIFRERLGDTRWCWCHIKNRGLVFSV